ncbi:2Fe-2S iron-sulfur cluster binding domain-containing protein [Pseudomonas sp. TH03]|uniref:2Fe-2S iron-sulfur cluster-binding protein n=1 Tax=Pseudomonas sp. TH03 TaxID=2796369 RepID=UPI0019145A40|nr:2Fe-2S iron-sulfur cluster binding domain-containing protein [Pseudomonas sp. TH03]MBK5552634.1 2Fe-2S iron-sulfur cluster binding domain-containing protein [Pseudomonas sp. TH03]
MSTTACAPASPNSYQLIIEGTELQAYVAPGETVLKAGLRSGVKIAHLCMVGECGSCRCRLLRGKVRLKKDISHHVDHDAMRNGYLLACQSELLSDVLLAVPGLSSDVQGPALVTRSGRIKSAISLNHNIRHLVLELDAPLTYEAGQYAQLSIPGHPALAQEARCYSFCSAPLGHPQIEVEFHVRLVPGGQFTEWLFAEDRIGECIELTGPLGDFTVHNVQRPMVLIAGGSGLAPIKSILEHLSAQQSAPDVTLFFAARTQDDLYCLSEIAKLQANWPAHSRMLFEPVLSNEPGDSDWRGLAGYCGEHISSFCSPADSSFYLCGPPPMIDSILRQIEGVVEPHYIHYDRFIDRSNMAQQ